MEKENPEVKEELPGFKQEAEKPSEPLIDKGLEKELKLNVEKYLVDDVVNSRNPLKKKFRAHRIGTALIFERVGKSEVFDGAYAVLTNTDEKLGTYIVVKYKNKFIYLDNVLPEDWQATRNNAIKKMLQVVKFNEDDFRVRAHIDGTWYTKRPVFKTIVNEVEVMNEDGEVQVIEEEAIATDESGEPIIDHYEETKFDNPRGISQTGRQAIRIGTAYIQRMREKREAKKGFFEKYAPHILLLVMMIMFSVTTYMTTKMQVESFEQNLDKVQENQENFLFDPEKFAQSVVDKQQRMEAEKGAPPS